MIHKNEVRCIKSYVNNITTSSGVYQMIDRHGKIIYVGKAKNLKKRVSSYFNRSAYSGKTQAMLRYVDSVEVIVTQTENEALLLENSLIKQNRPRYNILFRDDKSYPYLILSKDCFPRLGLYRGRKKLLAEYFGPYPNIGAANDVLRLLQKLFLIRSCKNSFFASRTRPCLEYQIKRCTAPCVNFIDKESYAVDVAVTRLFLHGKSQSIVSMIQKKMDVAAKKLQYELASKYRDQIKNLREVQQTQVIDSRCGDADVIAADMSGGVCCVELLMVRNGIILGNKVFSPKVNGDFSGLDSGEIFSSFITQHYFNQIQFIPSQILLSHAVCDKVLLQNALTQTAKKKVVIKSSLRGKRAEWMKMAKLSCRQSLEARIARAPEIYEKFLRLQKILDLPNQPDRIECFDISHTGGEATVASCVVFDKRGPVKEDYRRFNIENGGCDDFAAMRMAVLRHFTRIKTTGKQPPSIVIIDGGKGQLAQVNQVLEALEIHGIVLIAVAKGVSRKPGCETIFINDSSNVLDLMPHDPALHLIQNIRDEAHRFAITGHRAKYRKVRKTSLLENIPGIGAVRRKKLLNDFGGLQGLKKASIVDIAKVDNINRQLSERIYEFLRTLE